MAKLILTNSYFNAFDLLCKELEERREITHKNLVFCEEKSSLMVERKICAEFGGSFNTEVYSFGNFLRVFGGERKTLSKEGSAMVIRKLIKQLPLTTLNRGREISATVFELIAQLKSAGVGVSEVKNAADSANGILKNKLADLFLIYSAYENYLVENALADQNQAFSDLPKLIESLEFIKHAKVFIVGYSGLTVQNMQGVSALVKCAKNFTAILPYGENKFAFVNETAGKIEKLFSDNGVPFEKQFIPSPYTVEGEIISENVFSPKSYNAKKFTTDKVKLLSATTVTEETEKVACLIKQQVMGGKRYKDFTVIVPENYDKTAVEKAFTLLNVPYYMDGAFKVENHPLITLILSYADIHAKNYERETVLSLIKNPLFLTDKDLADGFINYVYKYNVSFSRFTKPFTLGGEECVENEKIRKKLVKFVGQFNPCKMLENNGIEEKLTAFAQVFNQKGEKEISAVNGQICDKVVEIIKEINFILGSEYSARDFKHIFLSGVSALKLSIIPQYNDAVFIGGFKEGALVRANNLFVMGLTSSVPGVKEDVALLTDNDIDALMGLKVFIEPKIKIVNHRLREEVAMGLSAFNENIYLSYSTISENSEVTLKSQVVSFMERSFTITDFPQTEKYLSLAQGLKNFALDCKDYTQRKVTDIGEAVAFYGVAEDKAKLILETANAEIKLRLNGGKALPTDTISATVVEDYYTCPYKAFMKNVVRIKERETGEVTALALGNIMHEILFGFIKQANTVKNENELSDLFEKVSSGVLSKPEYEKYFSDAKNSVSMQRFISESKKHCKNGYALLTRSRFKPNEGGLEKSFNLRLLNGKVSLYGVIDRVDTFDDYFRIIDYKTGKVEVDEKTFYSGKKLQLYLYALSINDKKLAGAYYVDLEDEYKDLDGKNPSIFAGKTLDDVQVLSWQDSEWDTTGGFLPVSVGARKVLGLSSERVLSAHTEYAKIMCENATEQMLGGVIVASPLEGSCEHCKYLPLCFKSKLSERVVKEVGEKTVTEAVYGGEEDA